MADGGGEPDNPHLFNDEGAANAEVAANLQEDGQPLDVTDVKDVKVWRLRGRADASCAQREAHTGPDAASRG